ncbi:hypothetical protein D3C84_426160 [compost metagenome]
MTPDALVREAARAGFSSVGLRLHLAMAGGIAYPLAPGGQALRQLKTTLDSEGVVVNEIEFVELKPQVDVAGFASLLDSGAQLDRRYIHGVQWCDALAPTGGGNHPRSPRGSPAARSGAVALGRVAQCPATPGALERGNPVPRDMRT